MKKYLLIIIIILSITISYFVSKDYNLRLFANYNQYQDHIAFIERKESIPLFIQIKDNSEKNVENFIQKLIEFSKNKYTFTFVYSEYNDVQEISCFGLYTQKHKIIDDLRSRGATGIDFQSIKKQGYYSTELSDKRARKTIKIIDNQIFNDYNRYTKIVSLGDSIKELSTKKEIALYFFDKDVNKFEMEFNNFLKTNDLYDKITYDNLYDSYHGAQLELISQESLKEIFLFIFYTAIVYIAFLLIYFTKKKKTILIQKLHGISYEKIIYKEVIPIIFVHFIMFIMVFILSVNFWTYGRMIYELDLLKEMIVIVLGLASIFIVVIVFIYFLLRIFISIKNLKSSSFSSKNIIYIMILKVIVLSLMTAPMMELIEQCYHLGVSYFYIHNQYETISNLCYIDGNLNKSYSTENVFNTYSQKNGIYCDFDTYYHNTLDVLKEMYEDIDEEDLKEQALDFPVIYVNANYLKAMNQNIYRKDGTKIELDQLKKDKLFVPSQYMASQLENVLINGSSIQGQIETIEIKDTGTYINYGLRTPYTLTNPVIYLITQKNDNCYMQNFFIPYNDTLSKEIYELTHEKVDLKSCQNFLDNETNSIKDDFIQYGCIVVLYISIYTSLLYQSVFWFVEEFKKLLVIEYIFGKSRQERYQELYILNGMIYIVPLIINILIKDVAIISLIELYSISMIIEILIMYVVIRRIETTNVGTILKGDYHL